MATSSTSMFYERPVLLDRDRHRRRRVRASEGFPFARHADSAFLAGVEFNEACKHYAIAFARAGERVVPVAMLGLRARENLFVDAAGRFEGGYVPAFLRRYPFVLADLPGQGLGLCVDEAYAGWNEDEGEALFDAQGAETPYLRQQLAFLSRYQAEVQRTEAFCRRLQEAGLLVETNARAELPDGRSFTVRSVLVVDEKKLQALPDATVLALFRSGELQLIAMHLLSLSNMKELVDRLAARQSPMQPPPLPGA